MLTVDHPVEGRAAVTSLTVAGHSRCLRYGGWVTTLDLSPSTGRRHQLRRHLALVLGHPILGDPLYTPLAQPGGAKGRRLDELMAGGPAQARGAGANGDSSEGEGDGDGGGGGADGTFELLRGWGMALFAAALEFDHPATGRRVSWELPEPERFTKLRAQQQARWEKFSEPALGLRGGLASLPSPADEQ